MEKRSHGRNSWFSARLSHFFLTYPLSFPVCIACYIHVVAAAADDSIELFAADTFESCVEYEKEAGADPSSPASLRVTSSSLHPRMKSLVGLLTAESKSAYEFLRSAGTRAVSILAVCSVRSLNARHSFPRNFCCLQAWSRWISSRSLAATRARARTATRPTAKAASSTWAPPSPVLCTQPSWPPRRRRALHLLLPLRLPPLRRLRHLLCRRCAAVCGS